VYRLSSAPMCELLSDVPHGTDVVGRKQHLGELFIKEQEERQRQMEQKTPENKETYTINIDIEEMVKEALTCPLVEL
jgi:hypothetical protein